MSWVQQLPAMTSSLSSSIFSFFFFPCPFFSMLPFFWFFDMYYTPFSQSLEMCPIYLHSFPSSYFVVNLPFFLSFFLPFPMLMALLNL